MLLSASRRAAGPLPVLSATQITHFRNRMPSRLPFSCGEVDEPEYAIIPRSRRQATTLTAAEPGLTGPFEPTDFQIRKSEEPCT